MADGLMNMAASESLKFECGICLKEFSTSWCLQIHIKSHDEKRSFDCHECGKVLPDFDIFFEHLKEHILGSDPVESVESCSVCGKQYPASQMAMHQRTHVFKPGLTCKKCGKSFGSSKVLKLHKRTHAKNIPFQCSTCGLKFASRNAFMLHWKAKCNSQQLNNSHSQPGVVPLQSVHGIRSPLRSTEQSQKAITIVQRNTGKANLRSIKSKLNFEDVIKVGKSFKCSACGQRFGGRLRALKHFHMHQTGQFRCEHCGKCFTSNSNLVNHSKDHNTSAYKSQSLVDEQFAETGKTVNASDLILEKGTQFVCKVCNKSFGSRQKACVHTLCHRKKKGLDSVQLNHPNGMNRKTGLPNTTFQCDHANLQQQHHTKSKKKVVPKSGEDAMRHTCSECTSTFISAQELKSHLSVHIKEHALALMRILNPDKDIAVSLLDTQTLAEAVQSITEHSYVKKGNSSNKTYNHIPAEQPHSANSSIPPLEESENPCLEKPALNMDSDELDPVSVPHNDLAQVTCIHDNQDSDPDNDAHAFCDSPDPSETIPTVDAPALNPNKCISTDESPDQHSEVSSYDGGILIKLSPSERHGKSFTTLTRASASAKEKSVSSLSTASDDAIVKQGQRRQNSNITISDSGLEDLKDHEQHYPNQSFVKAEKTSPIKLWSVPRILHNHQGPKVSSFQIREKIIRKEGKYQCAVCLKVFTEERKTMTHVRNHIEDKPFTCEDCGLSLARKNALEVHKKRHEGRRAKGLPPLKSSYTVIKRFGMDININREDSVLPSEDQSSLKHYTDGMDTSLSSDIQLEDLPDDASACSDQTASSANAVSLFSKLRVKRMDIHANIVKKDDSSQCNICKREFGSYIKAYSHVRNHVEKKKFKCDECGLEMRSKNHYSLHKQGHETRRLKGIPQRKPFKSWSCDVHTLKSNRVLDDGKFVCKICRKEFADLSCLDCHLRRHFKKYRCLQCEKIFEKKSGLEEHEVMHKLQAEEESKRLLDQFPGVQRNVVVVLERLEDTELAKTPGIWTFVSKSAYQNSAIVQDSSLDGSEMKSERDVFTKNVNQQSASLKPTSVKGILSPSGIDQDKYVRVPEGLHCLVCDKVFKESNIFSIDEHMDNHFNLFYCPVCCFSFSTKGFLWHHIAKSTHVSLDADGHLKGTLGERTLFFYNKVEVLGTSYLCKVCHKNFTDREKVRDHVTSHFDNRMTQSESTAYQQKHVKRNNTSSFLAEDIEQSDHNVKPSEPALAQENQQPLSKSDRFFDHISKSGDDYLCKICQNLYTSKEKVKKHVRSHLFSSKFKCNICLQTFKYKKNLLLHQGLHGQIETEQDVTNHSTINYQSGNKEDGKIKQREDLGHGDLSHSSSSLTNFSMQEYVEERGDIFYCTICARKFESYQDIAVHMKIHLTETVTRNWHIASDEFEKQNQTSNVTKEGQHLENAEKNQGVIQEIKTECLDDHKERPASTVISEEGLCDVSDSETAMDEIKTYSGVHNHDYQIGNSAILDKTESKTVAESQRSEGEKFSDLAIMSDETILCNVKTVGKDICCTICNEVFTDREKVYDHVRCHFMKKFRCRFCERTFQRRSLLRSHKRLCHGQDKQNEDKLESASEKKPEDGNLKNFYSMTASTGGGAEVTDRASVSDLSQTVKCTKDGHDGDPVKQYTKDMSHTLKDSSKSTDEATNDVSAKKEDLGYLGPSGAEHSFPKLKIERGHISDGSLSSSDGPLSRNPPVSAKTSDKPLNLKNTKEEECSDMSLKKSDIPFDDLSDSDDDERNKNSAKAVAAALVASDDTEVSMIQSSENGASVSHPKHQFSKSATHLAPNNDGEVLSASLQEDSEDDYVPDDNSDISNDDDDRDGDYKCESDYDSDLSAHDNIDRSQCAISSSYQQDRKLKLGKHKATSLNAASLSKSSPLMKERSDPHCTKKRKDGFSSRGKDHSSANDNACEESGEMETVIISNDDIGHPKELQDNFTTDEAGRFHCGICDVISDSMDDIGNHIISQHKKSRDDDQQQHFSSNDHLKKKPIKQSTIREKCQKVDGMYQCKLCWKKFIGKMKCESHIRYHLTTYKYSCDVCGLACKSKLTARGHQYAHINFRPYMCKICSKTFLMNASLRFHEKTHSKEEKVEFLGYLKCETCDEIFCSKTVLAKHAQNHKKSHDCYFCGTSFETKIALDNHQYEETHYKCTYCDKTFKIASSLRIHVKGHDDKEVYPCELCGKICKSRTSLRSHVQQHSGVGKYKCEICGQTSVRKNWLETHMKDHEAGGGKCLHCKRFYKTSTSLEIHQLMHKAIAAAGEDFIKKERLRTERVSEYACPICETIVTTYDQLRNHIGHHLKEKKFKCNICNMAFHSGTYLQAHIKIHNNDLPFQCDLCPKRAASKTILNLHVKQRHLDFYNGKFPCDICQKVLKTKGDLKKHQLCHEKRERNHACDECDLKFYTATMLKSHKLNHSAGYDFICELCGTRYKNKYALRNHMMRHGGKKEFKCEQCGKEFLLKAYLMTHLKIHKNERKFKCSECGKAFNHRHGMNDHMRTHTGQKPYECKLCDRRFTDRSARSSHMKTHRVS